MRLIDADKLDDTIIRLNEEDWQITRYEYKRIDGVVFEMPTVQAIPIDELKREIKNTFETGWCDCHVDTMMQIIDKISMELESE